MLYKLWFLHEFFSRVVVKVDSNRDRFALRREQQGTGGITEKIRVAICLHAEG